MMTGSRLDSQLRAAYSRMRGSELAEDVPASVVVSAALRRAPELLRGFSRSRRYESYGGRHFRGRGVQVHDPSYFSCGRFVCLGDGVVVSAFGDDGVVLHDRVTVARGAFIAASGVISEPGVGVSIGARSSIGMNNVIWGQGGVSIGAGCLFGPNVLIVSENHRFSEIAQPIWTQGSIRERVIVGDDCWIGAGAVLTAGVNIGRGSVIGANAVVTETVPEYSVAVGVPARVVSRRSVDAD